MAETTLPVSAAGVNAEQTSNLCSPTAAETAAWDEYAAAHKRAHETLDVKDGIAAGKAWGRWVRMFERPRHTVSDGSNVVYLGARP